MNTPPGGGAAVVFIVAAAAADANAAAAAAEATQGAQAGKGGKGGSARGTPDARAPGSEDRALQGVCAPCAFCVSVWETKATSLS